MKYRLPCNNCDAFLSVEPKDAGRELPCPSCQTLQKLPSLNAIRNLEVDPDSQPTKTKKSWSMLQGICFGLGVICLAAGIIGAGMNYSKYQSAKKEFDQLLQVANGTLPDYTDITPVEKVFGSMPVVKMWPEWRDALKIEPDQWMPSNQRIIEDNMTNMQSTMVTCAGLAVFGLLAMVVSMFLP